MENNESSEVLNEEEEEIVQENGDGNDDDPAMNFIQLLLGSETDNPVLNDQQVAQILNNNWIREIRSRALQYIVRTAIELGFLVRTVYVSVMYLNRTLAGERAYVTVIHFSRFHASPTVHGRVNITVRLLAVSCLSLSAKMGEPRANVPLLSQYPLGNLNTNVSEIRRMESLVLRDLNWNLNCVTPFPFVQFFQSRFGRRILEDTRTRTDGIILSTLLRDVRLMNDHRPSVIAVAATLFAVNNNLTRQELEVEINALPLNGFLNIDNVWYCYNRLRELNN